MRRILLSLTLVFLSLGLHGQDTELMSVFNNQIEAFNQHDIEKLVENVSDDFKYYYLTSNELVLEVEGKEKFGESMKSYFGAVSNVTTEILNHFIEGNKITFQEKVSYLAKDGRTLDATALGVYEIKDGKITRCWYFTN